MPWYRRKKTLEVEVPQAETSRAVLGRIEAELEPWWHSRKTGTAGVELAYALLQPGGYRLVPVSGVRVRVEVATQVASVDYTLDFRLPIGVHAGVTLAIAALIIACTDSYGAELGIFAATGVVFFALSARATISNFEAALLKGACTRSSAA